MTWHGPQALLAQRCVGDRTDFGLLGGAGLSEPGGAAPSFLLSPSGEGCSLPRISQGPQTVSMASVPHFLGRFSSLGG